MSVQVMLAIVVTVVFGALIWLSGRRADRRRRDRFQSRRLLTGDEIWDKYYSSRDLPRNLVEDALGAIERATSVPVGRLRPGDRFCGELAPESGWETDDSLAELSWNLRRAHTQDDSAIETVDDFIHAFCHQAASGPK